MGKLYSVTRIDWVHGAIMTVLGAFTGGIIELLAGFIQTGHIDFSLNSLAFIGLSAVVAGLSYIQKKFFSNEEGKFGGRF